jgi:chromosome segregation ATPase
MYLKRLEIQGFKSFAKPSIFEFEQGITAIVGPNGSGKSNVSDSLRWVLGEQSTKLLRGKKSEDVIFAGSDKKVRQSFAEVVATFDNRDHKIPVDSSEVSIGRRVDRSGESEYLINGNRVRLMDIVDLVLKSNIGTSRYTVIGQGTIDQMILSGTTEVKNLIDEASGVKTYYLKREKTLRRLEQTAQNLMRAEDLLKELEPRVKSLRRQAKRMEARDSVEQELKQYRKQSLAGQYWQLRHQSDAVVKELTALRQEAKEETQAKVDDLETQLKAANTKHEEARRDAGAKQKILQDLERQLQNLYKQLERPAASDWKASQQDLAELDKIVSAMEGTLTQADEQALRRSAQQLVQLWQKFRSSWQETGSGAGSLEDIKEQLVKISAQKDALVAEVNELAVAESQAKVSAEFLQQQVTSAKQAGAGSSQARQTQLEVEKAKIDTHLETVVMEIRAVLTDAGLDEITAQAVPPAAPEVADKIVKLQRQLDLIGGVDELTIQEYHETEARFTSLEAQVNDLKKSMDDLRAVLDELDTHIKTVFNEAFHKINTQFEQYFRMLFNGGRAYLSLVKSGQEEDEETLVENSEEALEKEPVDQLRPEEKVVAKYEKAGLHIAGVEIRATPPGKKLSTIQSLSGGERSLTSIALLCSLLTCFPSPFVVLDEVDAALDEANTIRFGQILGTLAHQTQFITITHNRETMAQANTLYGVTMGDDGVSKLLSIKIDQAKAYAK